MFFPLFMLLDIIYVLCCFTYAHYLFVLIIIISNYFLICWGLEVFSLFSFHYGLWLNAVLIMSTSGCSSLGTLDTIAFTYKKKWFVTKCFCFNCPAKSKPQDSEVNLAAEAFTSFKHLLLPVTDRNPYLSEGTRQVTFL